MDSKIRQIERRFRSRESSHHSGATDLHVWPMEDRVTAVIGNIPVSLGMATSEFMLTGSPFAGQRPMIKPDTISSFCTEENKENQMKQDTDSNASRDVLMPSTSGTKKLSSKSMKMDQVISYLTKSVR